MGLSDESMMNLAQSAAKATISCFTRKSGAAAARELSRVVNFQLEAAFARVRERNADIHCREGCQYCCNLRVAAFPYEASAISAYLDTDLPADLARELKQRVAERAALISGMTEEQHFATNVECAFLYDGRCRIYPVRPSSCAGYHSLSRNQCEYAFHHPTDLVAEKPESDELKYFHAAIDEGVKQALESLGLDAQKGELHSVVAAMLT